MIEAISSRWWVFLLRGLAALIVAVIAFVQPGAALIGLVLVLALYAFIAGVLALAASASGIAGERWWALLIEGLVGIIAAALIWAWPIASAIAFVYLVAAWMIVTGVIQIAAGIGLRDMIKEEWILILTGVISVAFGVWVFRGPLQGTVATAFLFGWYFALIGLAQIAIALRLRGLSRAVPATR